MTSPSSSSQPAHTDHPLRHWDRTCPACIAEGQSEKPQPSGVDDLLRLWVLAGEDRDWFKLEKMTAVARHFENLTAQSARPERVCVADIVYASNMHRERADNAISALAELTQAAAQWIVPGVDGYAHLCHARELVAEDNARRADKTASDKGQG